MAGGETIAGPGTLLTRRAASVLAGTTPTRLGGLPWVNTGTLTVAGVIRHGRQ